MKRKQDGSRKKEHILIISFTRAEAEFIEWTLDQCNGFIGLNGREKIFKYVRRKMTDAINKMYE
jgi:hypothetical protein